MASTATAHEYFLVITQTPNFSYHKKVFWQR
jgi:hypothetical protein